MCRMKGPSTYRPSAEPRRAEKPPGNTLVLLVTTSQGPLNMVSSPLVSSKWLVKNKSLYSPLMKTSERENDPVQGDTQGLGGCLCALRPSERMDTEREGSSPRLGSYFCAEP